MRASRPTLESKLTGFAMLINNTCAPIDTNSSWKRKLAEEWSIQKEFVKESTLEALEGINSRDTITLPEGCKFVFQLNFHGRQALWKRQEPPEEILLRHARFIIANAAGMLSKSTWRELWQFDEQSYIFRPKKPRRDVSDSR